MTFIFFTLSGVFLFTALHPFITYPVSLLVIRHFHFRPLIPHAPQANDTFALCVCAYNEEAVIAEKVANLLALKHILPGLQIYIYVDNATDRTAEILSQYHNEIHLHVSPKRCGKTYGMNLLVAQTQASIIIFTDANVLFDVPSLQLLPTYFSDPSVGCVCGHLHYTNTEESITSTNGSYYWRLEEYIKHLESDTGSVMGADGSIFAIRRALHYPPPDHIIDDMYVSLPILCEGYRIVHAPDIVAKEHCLSSAVGEFQRKTRIACQAFNVHRLLWPRLKRLNKLNLYKYISHKFLRWFTVYWLLAAVIFFEAGMIAAGIGSTGITLLFLIICLGIVGIYLRYKPALQIADILLAFCGTGWGILCSLTGQTFQIWAPSMRGNT